LTKQFPQAERVPYVRRPDPQETLNRLESINANRSFLASIPPTLSRLSFLHCAHTPQPVDARKN
jgi:hypothetical protein